MPGPSHFADRALVGHLLMAPAAFAGRPGRHSDERDDSGNPIGGIEPMKAEQVCHFGDAFEPLELHSVTGPRGAASSRYRGARAGADRSPPPATGVTPRSRGRPSPSFAMAVPHGQLVRHCRRGSHPAGKVTGWHRGVGLPGKQACVPAAKYSPVGCLRRRPARDGGLRPGPALPVQNRMEPRHRGRHPCSPLCEGDVCWGVRREHLAGATRRSMPGLWTPAAG